MKRHCFRLFAAILLTCAPARADVFNMPSGQTSVQFVTIGDAGNGADTTGYGAVGYVYKMDKYDVTAAQYTEFLNAVASNDTYGLWNSYMATDFPTVSITRNGRPGSYTYSVAGNGNVPIFAASWSDAARFTNWLHNGQPTGSEAPGTTETGAYTLNGATSNAALMTVTRNAGARYFIPSENEWYKSAYYKSGGTAAGYWTYATRSDVVPSSLLSALGTNNANYYDNGQSDPVNYLTSVGAFASSPSAYGTFDQAGNVWQWNESITDGAARGLRGGSLGATSDYLPSSSRIHNVPTVEYGDIGFRIAMVPEPGTMTLLACGAAGLLLWAQRRR